MIRDTPRHITYPQYFSDNDKKNYKMEEVVNQFNNYFVNIGPNLAEKIPMTDTLVHDDTPIKRNTSSMYLNPVLEKEIIDVVNKCKNKTSIDCDDIDIKTVKRVITGISKPLAHICNLSFQTGQFPNKMKTAKVIPMYKTGNKHHFTNYRPISLLPQFSKILEKLFNDRLCKFIDKYKLLTDSQYGFRTNRSTALALTELTEEITNATDNRKFAIGTFIDLKKAFDTINHNILITKLEQYGIWG